MPIKALAERGEEALPLIKRLLTDKHHGVRAGAVATPTHMYRSDSDAYRAEVPEDLAEVINRVRPLTTDESRLVRDAVSGFVQGMKVLNEDVYEMLHVMARDGAKVQNFVRYGVNPLPSRPGPATIRSTWAAS